MRILMIANLGLAVLLSSAPVAAATDTQTLDQIVVDAQKVRAEAEEIKQLLRAGQPDWTLVNQRLTSLASHADALKQAMDGFNPDASSLTTQQKAAFDRARAATDTLQVLLSNKTAMLADAQAASKNRGLLRAKADGIAKRADIVEQQVSRMRS